MRLAVAIERARSRIVAKPDGAVLVRHPGERNALTEKEIAREQTFMALVSVHRTGALLVEEFFEFLDQAFVSFFIVRLVLQHDFTVAV